MSKTFRYTTREGAVWLVRECVPLPHAPGFWLGWKKGRHDREQVVIHEHRAEEVNGEGGKLQVREEQPVT